MTGPEHYKAAEEILADIAITEKEFATADVMSSGLRAKYAADRQAAIDIAQVHATLADAAATAMASMPRDHASSGMDRSDFNAWDDVAGTPS